MNKILKCTKCAQYTMNEICDCGAKAATPKPAKFSPQDAYASYRRKVKLDDRKKGGLL